MIGVGAVRGRAQVLAEDFGAVTENTSKWHDNRLLRSGQFVVVDEASPVGTFALDTLREQARNAGVEVVLVGDWAQLSPVEAGGAFHMLVHDRDLAPELADVRRFAHVLGKGRVHRPSVEAASIVAIRLKTRWIT